MELFQALMSSEINCHVGREEPIRRHPENHQCLNIIFQKRGSASFELWSLLWWLKNVHPFSITPPTKNGQRACSGPSLIPGTREKGQWQGYPYLYSVDSWTSGSRTKQTFKDAFQSKRIPLLTSSQVHSVLRCMLSLRQEAQLRSPSSVFQMPTGAGTCWETLPHLYSIACRSPCRSE